MTSPIPPVSILKKRSASDTIQPIQKKRSVRFEAVSKIIEYGTRRDAAQDIKAQINILGEDDLLLAQARDSHVKLKEYEKALTYANRAYDRAPNSFEATLEKGRIHYLLNQTDAARECFKKAAEMESADHKSLFYLATKLNVLGEKALSIKCCQKSLES